MEACACSMRFVRSPALLEFISPPRLARVAMKSRQQALRSGRSCQMSDCSIKSEPRQLLRCMNTRLSLVEVVKSRHRSRRKWLAPKRSTEARLSSMQRVMLEVPLGASVVCDVLRRVRPLWTHCRPSGGKRETMCREYSLTWLVVVGNDGPAGLRSEHCTSGVTTTSGRWTVVVQWPRSRSKTRRGLLTGKRQVERPDPPFLDRLVHHLGPSWS